MPNASGTLPNATKFGPAHLRLTDLSRSVPVWIDILGLSVIAPKQSGVELGVAGRTLVTLHEGASGRAPGKSVGLFHLALHLPSRLELARAVARLRAAGYPHSAQDHVLSESVYLADADGNGIELCLETPQRGGMEMVDGKPRFMTSDGVPRSGLEPLDIDNLLRELDDHGPGDGLMPAGTFVGHVHMRSNGPEAVVEFYTDVLGFKPNIASAAFGMFDCGTAARPHMVAFNAWGGRNLPGTPEAAAGLQSVTIELPAATFAEVEDRLTAAAVSLDRDAAAIRTETVSASPWPASCFTAQGELRLCAG